jgi:hypothetical protein
MALYADKLAKISMGSVLKDKEKKFIGGDAEEQALVDSPQ